MCPPYRLKEIDMKDPADDENEAKKDSSGISYRDYSRSRREGAFISPFGTEGCQWDGFPEPPDDYCEQCQPDPPAGQEETE
jgi:hypothetical protein